MLLVDKRACPPFPARFGGLRLRSIALAALSGVKAEKVAVTLDGQPLPARHAVDKTRVLITLAEPVEMKAGQTLGVALS